MKAVLPAFVPDMTYEGMAVADGVGAGLAWEMRLRSSDPAECERLRIALLQYCGQDTLALVRLVERLRLVSTRT